MCLFTYITDVYANYWIGYKQYKRVCLKTIWIGETCITIIKKYYDKSIKKIQQ